jgi:hypothetical protein
MPRSGAAEPAELERAPEPWGDLGHDWIPQARRPNPNPAGLTASYP